MEAEWSLFPVIKEMGDTERILCPGAPQSPAWYQQGARETKMETGNCNAGYVQGAAMEGTHYSDVIYKQSI